MSQGAVVLRPPTNYNQQIQGGAYGAGQRLAVSQAAHMAGGTPMLIQGHGFQSKRFRSMAAVQDYPESTSSTLFILSEYQRLRRLFPLLDEKVSY